MRDGYWTSILSCLLRDGVAGAAEHLDVQDLDRLMRRAAPRTRGDRLALFEHGPQPGVRFRNAALTSAPDGPADHPVTPAAATTNPSRNRCGPDTVMRGRS
jgi:hypothetical protein